MQNEASGRGMQSRLPLAIFDFEPDFGQGSQKVQVRTLVQGQTMASLFGAV